MMKNKLNLLKKDILVISFCAAFLVLTLGAVTNRGRTHAKSIICQVNLGNWGHCYQLYANDWDGKLPSFVGGTVGQTTYMGSLKPYYGDNEKIRICPSTSVTVQPGWTEWNGSSSSPGQTFKVWYIDAAQTSWLADDDCGVGSYGENAWIKEINGRDEVWGKFSSMDQPSEVPLMLDARWNNAWVNEAIPQMVDSAEEFYNIGNWSSMNCFAMRRHDGGVNAAMGDLSTITVTAEDLWQLKWHKEFEINNNVDLSWMGSSW